MCMCLIPEIPHICILYLDSLVLNLYIRPKSAGFFMSTFALKGLAFQCSVFLTIFVDYGYEIQHKFGIFYSASEKKYVV